MKMLLMFWLVIVDFRHWFICMVAVLWMGHHLRVNFEICSGFFCYFYSEDSFISACMLDFSFTNHCIFFTSSQPLSSLLSRSLSIWRRLCLFIYWSLLKCGLLFF